MRVSCGFLVDFRLCYLYFKHFKLDLINFENSVLISILFVVVYSFEHYVITINFGLYDLVLKADSKIIDLVFC